MKHPLTHDQQETLYTVLREHYLACHEPIGFVRRQKVLKAFKRDERVQSIIASLTIAIIGKIIGELIW